MLDEPRPDVIDFVRRALAGQRRFVAWVVSFMAFSGQRF